MPTRASGVIRPNSSDLIFDHPYNARIRARGHQRSVVYALQIIRFGVLSLPHVTIEWLRHSPFGSDKGEQSQDRNYATTRMVSKYIRQAERRTVILPQPTDHAKSQLTGPASSSEAI
jgi:hypothetical protein